MASRVVLRLRVDHSGQLATRLLKFLAPHVRNSQVEAHAELLWIYFDGFQQTLHRLLSLPELGEHHAKIRKDVRALRRQLERRLISLARTLQVPLLLHLDPTGKFCLGALGGCLGSNRQSGQSENERKARKAREVVLTCIASDAR